MTNPLYSTAVYAKDIGPSDLTDMQCLWSDASFYFTADQNGYIIENLNFLS